MNKEEKSIISALRKQFDQSFKMIQEAIKCIPMELWHNGSSGWYFSMTAYHIIETIEFYNGSDPDAMKWGARAGYDWDAVKDVESEVLPLITKNLVKLYLEYMKNQVEETLSSLGDDGLFTTDGFHWFESRLEKYLYLMRHNMHHVGELIRSLREWGCERAKWA